MAENAEITDLLKSICQVGIVVESVDEKVEGMRRVFGIEPDSLKVMEYPYIIYRGRKVDAKARVAAYNCFGVQIEFMEPLGEDDSMWWDHVRSASPIGLHHVRFNSVVDVDAVTKLMAQRGIEVYQEGGSVVNPGGKFVYYDTADALGFIAEVAIAAPEK